MPRVTLVDLIIRALNSTGRQEMLWCSQTPNFGLLLSQAGGKSFFFMAPRTRRRIALGKWPPTSLKDARNAARRLLVDPQATAITPATFSEAFRAYYEHRILPNYRPQTAKQLKGSLIAMPACCFSQRIPAISPQLLANVLAAPTIPLPQANHLYGVLRTFFKWAHQ
jgi:hypothetical protein